MKVLNRRRWRSFQTRFARVARVRSEPVDPQAENFLNLSMGLQQKGQL